MNFSYDALMRHLPQRRTTPVPFEEEEEEQQEILLLTAPPADWAGESIIASSISGWPAKKKIDGAGLAFEFYLQHGHFPHQAERLDDDSPFSSRSSTPALDDEVDTATSDEYLKKRRKRLEVEEDHYELLGLGHLRYKSTQKDIRDAYRKMVLLYHPDKGGDEATFKKIFKAHDTLSNENKKKIFDSSEHFNDYFPSDIPAGKDFYTVYSEVFERFSKWSVNKDIPSLGDDSTNLNMVNRFYKFWNNFQSWRDFSFDVEYDLEEADSREEKRWMEKQNKKGIEKLKKEERSKIVRLVETAYRLDPRVNKMKEAMEADALRRKKVREEAIRKLHEESEQKGAAERAQKEAEEQAKIKEAKDLERLKNKQLADLRKAKDRMRKVAYANNMNLEHLEKIFIEIKQAPALNALCQEIEIAFTTDAKEAHKLIISLIEDFRKKETEKYFDKKANGQKESRTGAPWSQEELAQLARAVTKIPAGVQRRWELISELIPSRTQDQIIAKVAETKMKRPEELTKEKNAAAAEAFALSQKQSTKGGDKIHIASAPSERLVEEEDEETKKKRLEEEEQKKKKLAEKKKRAAEAKKQKEEEERKKKEEEEAKIKAEEEKRRLKKEALKQKKIDDEKKKKEELAAAVEAKKLAEETKRAEAAAKKAAKKAAAEAAVSAQAQIQIPSPSPSPAPVATTTTEAPKKPAAPKKSAAPKKAAAPKATPVVEAPKVKSFSAAAGGVNAIPDANSPINWSPQQQKALEQALAKYPTSLGAARWDKIAAEVPEKTRKECVDRFKYLSQAVKAKQQKA